MDSIYFDKLIGWYEFSESVIYQSVPWVGLDRWCCLHAHRVVESFSTLKMESIAACKMESVRERRCLRTIVLHNME